tara:strand:- start:1474 stop:1800 length:327 start_codon:yes stop_codon:yes gene_type:complete
MSLIKTYYHSIHEKIMSDFHETALRRYEEEQEQLYREQLERDENPKFYWHIIAQNDHLLPEWEEYTDTEEEKDELISNAKRDGLHVLCTKHIEGETYAGDYQIAQEAS